MNELLNQEKYAERLNATEKKRYIHIKKEDREFIMKALGVTERTVFNATRFDEKRGNTEWIVVEYEEKNDPEKGVAQSLAALHKLRPRG